MSWYCKRKPTWRKDLVTYNSHPWIMFSFNWLVIIWRRGERGSFGIGRPRSRVWKNFGRTWTSGGWGVLKIWQFSWTSYVHHLLRDTKVSNTWNTHFFSSNRKSKCFSLVNYLVLGLSYNVSEGYLEPCQTSKMELFAKIVNDISAIDYFCRKLHV